MNWSLKRKLILGYFILGLVISIFSSLNIYFSTKDNFLENFKKHKLSILNVTSKIIDGDIHKKFNSKRAVKTPEFNLYFKKLRSIYISEKELHYFYTINYNKIDNEFYYVIDPVVRPNDIIWIESEFFSLEAFLDENNELIIDYNSLKHTRDFEFNTTSGNKINVQFLKENNQRGIFINGKKVFEVSILSKEVLVENIKLSRQVEFINTKVPIEDKKIDTRVSISFKSEVGSGTGVSYIENKELINTLRLVINEKDTSQKILSDFKKSSYGDFLIGYAPILDSEKEIIGFVIVEINSKDILDFQKRTILNSIFLSVVTFVITLFIGYFFAKYFTNPLEILINAVSDISIGNLKPIKKINSNDEFGKLSENFNSMIDNLKISYEVQFNLIEEISQINEGLEKKVEIRTKQILDQNIEIEKQIELAKKIQLSLLPEETSNIKQANISFSYIPMMSVGGDLFDFILKEDKYLYLFICDVSGHGVPAAFLATMVKMTLGDCYEKLLDPKECLEKIKKSLIGKLSGHFITASICKIDIETKTMKFANAGHLPIFRVKKNSEVESISAKGKLITEVFPLSCEEKTYQLNTGDKIILYTDGITEAKNKNKDLFGEEQFISILKTYYNLSSKKLTEQVFENLVLYTENKNANFDDDITLLIAEIN